MHEHNSFITLTYDNKHLPKNNTLIKRDLQLFFKRLRKNIHPLKIKYFACGEYGDEKERPHYHAIIFGYDFRVKDEYNEISPFKETDYGTLYNSTLLEKTWGKGHTTTAECNFETAAYVARYCTKKITGENAVGYYGGRLPEFATMSRRKPIGYSWLLKYYTDIYPANQVILGKRSLKVPKYYDKFLEKHDEDLYLDVKQDREKFLDQPEETLARLNTQHEIACHTTLQHSSNLQGKNTINPRDKKILQYRKTLLATLRKENGK